MPLRLVLSAAGLALGATSLLIARADPAYSFAGGSWTGAAALLGAGWALLGGGLGFWARRPRNAVGPLLVAASWAWFVAEWDNPGVGSALLFTIGLVLFAACPSLVAWAVLAYPLGRLRTRVERIAVVVSFAAGVLVLGLLPALFFAPATGGCAQCPTNLLLVADEPDLVAGFDRAGVRLGLASAVALIALIVWRFVRSSSVRRRLAAPVLLAAIVYLGLVGWAFATSLDRGFIGTGIVERRLWLAQAVALAALAAAVAWGRVRAHRTRSSLARLVVELGESVRPGGLRDALAAAIGETTLVIAYPVGGDRHVDASGRVVDVAPRDGRAMTPLVREGTPVAVLIHRPGLLDDAELVDQVASAARLALENERLQASLRTQERDLRASRARIVEAGDAERRRLERDLHDGAQQRLVGLLLGLRLVRNQLGSDAHTHAVARLEEASAELQRAVDELRELAHGIHPAVLSDEGLGAAVDALAERAARPLCIEAVPNERFPAPVENAAYRVVAEAVKVGATSVRVTRGDGVLRVDVDVVAVPEDLVELNDRVGALDGWIRVETGPGEGVRLRSEIPCVS